jgi:elongation factor 1-gamma
MSGKNSYTLYAPEASFRAFATLIAAEYNGIAVSVNTDVTNANKSPVGKLPILENSTNNAVIAFSSQASARYVASLRRDSGLLGNSLLETASIDAWIDWCAADVELPACVWFYPVAGYMPFQKDRYVCDAAKERAEYTFGGVRLSSLTLSAIMILLRSYEKAKADLANALSILNAHLLDKTYLVNDQITLADIVVASTLVYPMKLVCDKNYLKNYGNVVRWFQTCVNQVEFQQVIGTVNLCKKELTAPGQETSAAAAASTGNKKEEGGKKKEKKEDKKAKEAPVDDAPPAAAPEKKAEHPYKIMDKEEPSPFSMDAWKKTYSNAATYEEAMNTFWETFDSNGWSLWYQTYNYNEDNKRIFMTSNAVGGFQQRTDEIRKWAFGVMDVLGTEETALEIAGVWLLRGHTVEHMINANDDANWYTWKPLSEKGQPVSEESKKLVTEYWTAEKEIDGKPIQDSKVFK